MIAAAAAAGASECVIVSGPEDAALVRSLESALSGAGYAVREAGLDALATGAGLPAARGGLLALTDASALPVDAAGPLQAYLEGGGDLIALRAPLWHSVLVASADEWVDAAAYRAQHAAALAGQRLVDFTPAAVASWERGVSPAERTASYASVAADAAVGGVALEVRLPQLDGWDNLRSPAGLRFPAGHTLTTLWAQGSAHTRTVSVEWEEDDGSRWIAQLTLDDAWQLHVLRPEDFKYWQSRPEREGTGFRPAHAVRCCIGLAISHGARGGGPHAYRVAALGTAARTPLHDPLFAALDLPPADLLYPDYTYYEVRTAVSAACDPWLELWGAGGAVPLPAGAWRAPHPRPGGGGFGKGRGWRWQTLIDAQDAAGRSAGALMTLRVEAEGPHAGGMWLASGVMDANWYMQPAVMAAIGAAAARMRDGVFLIDGGAAQYTHFADAPVTLGATVYNAGAPRTDAEAVLALRGGAGAQAGGNAVPLVFDAGGMAQAALEAGVPEWPAEPLAAEAVLRVGGRVADRVSHEAAVWQPKPQPSYVTVRDGDFVLDGQRWRAHGVNYMPSSGVALEDGAAFEFWLGRRAYDPAIVQRDLERTRDLGLNALSVFIYHESLEDGNLLDLLRRADALGLKVNLSLRPGTPLDFAWEKVRALIERYRIPQHDTVFALDLAWEPMFGQHAARRRWDAAWRAWIDERYGGLEAAERDWGFAAPRDDAGAASNPLDAMMVEDGAWRAMTAAYRRFLDTLLYEHYRRAYDLVRGLDPHHLVSFRMTEAGNPTFNWDRYVPYDFPYLAAAVDILEPEAYGRIGDWDRVKPALFQHAYAQWAAPHLPVLWAEAGVSIIGPESWDEAPEKRAFQGDYYRDLYRLFVEADADGVFFWWYPGGWRSNERSDYGIVDPDGCERPAGAAIRALGPGFMAGPDTPPPDTWIECDRDRHPSGVAGIYEAAKTAYWAAREAGQRPGLRTAGTGTDSTNCPLDAVGNTPYNGSNPPKYLDGFFDRIEYCGADGQWREATRGAAVPCAPGAPLRLRATVVNLGEAAWRAAGDAPGAVALRASGALPETIPLDAYMPRFARRTIEFSLAPQGGPIVLGLEARGRARFGPRWPLMPALP